MSLKLLVVDDEASIRDTISGIFEDEGYKVESASSGTKAIALIKEGREYNVVLLDIWMDDSDGVETLIEIKKLEPHLPVIMISGHGDIETAVKATKFGAYDFIEKPPDFHKLILTVSHSIKECKLLKENTELKQKFKNFYPDIIGNSNKMSKLKQQIQVMAPTEGWVLIHGENGTGKEIIARQIHHHSDRSEQAFVEVNCAAIPEELIESELFGHEKGSFTGAFKMKIGKFDQADKGTLFLDEIADMSLKTQAKILRILQEQRFERVGGNEMISVNVRIVAASNKLLENEIKSGNFREDLYYRLNVIPIEVPPLRERAEDIPELVDFFQEFFLKNNNYPMRKMNPEVYDIFKSYHWPGNVRELKNIVERIMILSDGPVVTKEDIPPAIMLAVKNSDISKYHDTEPLVFDTVASIKQARDEFEKNYIITMLRKNEGNISKTADMIQMERSNLHKKIKQLGINLEEI